jgi:beta-1,4-mannosyl-glycoprotein beta-1,4-N-acetylglucosaminyltransferase
MSPNELAWLSENVRDKKVVIELGSWHGKSTRAICDNLPIGGKCYAIDTWKGSKEEQETNHVSAKQLDGDHAYDEFARNLWDHVDSGTCVPIRMHGRHAAKLLHDYGVLAQLIFIDAGHTYKEVVEDINSFMPLLDKNGIVCGHDFHQGLAPEVTKAVDEVFHPNIGNYETIWYTNAPTQPKIFDCIPFNNELDILERRFTELESVVDRFIICEAAFTHQGQPKPLYFQENIERFTRWLPKISHVLHVFYDIPEQDSVWSRERQQRDGVLIALPEWGNHYVIVSDCDEIPSAEAIKAYDGNGIAAFDMDLYYYNDHWKNTQRWQEARMAPLHKVREMKPCQIRYSKPDVILHGGVHLSYYGDEQHIQEKLKSFAHWEYNKPEFTNLDHIRECVNKGLDLFNRPDQQFVYVS